LIDEFAELDVSMASVAPSAAGQLPLPMLAEAGVRVGLGEDGQRDDWSPYGNTDMLDRTWQLAFTHGFRRDELIGHCLAIATVASAVMDRGTDRTVIHQGRVVADGLELV
jgi:cytosine deaminase